MNFGHFCRHGVHLGLQLLLRRRLVLRKIQLVVKLVVLVVALAEHLATRIHRRSVATLDEDWDLFVGLWRAALVHLRHIDGSKRTAELLLDLDRRVVVVDHRNVLVLRLGLKVHILVAVVEWTALACHLVVN